MSKLRERGATERQLLRWAKDRGWRPLRRNGNNHMEIAFRDGMAITTIPGKIRGKHLLRAIKAQILRAEMAHEGN